ncbi:hypothetical protein F0562_030594 [Nyssa sinensis]|uniref:Uncharacterized protein n=1 Tax=Nyssa sinensis TaxID=561372 RepID=A0A5J5B361_9ASTE|nr:hypothetical protein F0562_030594 [Nyssa sinensis]
MLMMMDFLIKIPPALEALAIQRYVMDMHFLMGRIRWRRISTDIVPQLPLIHATGTPPCLSDTHGRRWRRMISIDIHLLHCWFTRQALFVVLVMFKMMNFVLMEIPPAPAGPISLQLYVVDMWLKMWPDRCPILSTVRKTSCGFEDKDPAVVVAWNTFFLEAL